MCHSRAKHIDLRHHFIRDAVEERVVWLEYIPTADMSRQPYEGIRMAKARELCTPNGNGKLDGTLAICVAKPLGLMPASGSVGEYREYRE